MSISKSLFTNSLLNSSTRSLYNPISQNYKDQNILNSNDIIVLNTSFYNTLNIIQEFYGANMANKQYEKIPNSYKDYLNFYIVLQNVILQTKNPQLRVLFQLAQDTLVGSINSYTIYGDNLLLKLDKTNLQNKVNNILSGKNEKIVEVATATGQLSLNKTFKLATIFNTYILVYGCPAFGVGFDTYKIAFLADLLTKMGVNPYA
jgi:hypothetical protein